MRHNISEKAAKKWMLQALKVDQAGAQLFFDCGVISLTVLAETCFLELTQGNLTAALDAEDPLFDWAYEVADKFNRPPHLLARRNH